MGSVNGDIENIYLTDEYLIKNPSLHEKDSPWKVSKIIPLVDKFTQYIDKDEINLLDVGGGAGLILSEISTYIEESHGIKVNKYTLDLSPGILEIQRKNNPSLKRALNEDICKTSLADKEIDLTLMIDLLEHIPTPTEALEEVKRISKFVIFKVPLEDNLHLRTWDFIRRGKIRKNAVETVGHVDIYSFSKIKYQIEKHTGQVLDFHFTNVFHKNKMKIRSKMFRLSPKLCSLIFNDFIMVLVKCY